MNHANDDSLSGQVEAASENLQVGEGLKAKNRAVKGTYSAKVDQDSLLPEPTFRHYPADVRRRTDNVISAEPPPPPRRRQGGKESRGPKKLRDGRGRRLGNGESESESDDDDSKKYPSTRDDDDRKAKQVEDVGDQGRSRAALEAEEQKRVEQLRNLRIVQESWNSCYSMNRMRNEAERPGRMYGLFRESKPPDNVSWPSIPRSHQLSPPPDKDEVIAMQRRFREYLDATLSRGLEMDNSSGTSDDSTESPVARYLDVVIQRVELGVIQRLSQFNELGWGSMPPAQGLWLINNIQALHRACWRFVKTQDTSTSGAVKQAFDRFITAKNVLDVGRTQVYGSVDMVVDFYLGKVLEALHAAISIDLSKHLEQADERSTALYDLLRESRTAEELSAQYKEWVCQGMGSVIDKCCERWRDAVRHDIAEEFRRAMSAMRMEVRQEFFPNPFPHEGKLVLVLIKANYATAISAVSDEDAASIGWFETDGYQGLCRWYIDHTWDTGAFLVNLEGKVLGMHLWSGYYIDANAVRFDITEPFLTHAVA